MRRLATAALLLAFPLLAQEPLPDQPFAESIDVEVANLEVYVTGPDGRPVQGLSRADFELFVDGRKVEVVNFSEVAESAVSPSKEPPGEEPAPGPAAGGESPETEPAPPPEPPPLSLVVFVDNANLRPAGRKRVLRQLQGFFDSAVGPRDRVMLVTHDQGLNVRRPLSPGKESLAADLQKLEKLAARGFQQDIQYRQTLQLIQDGRECDEAEQIVRAYAAGVSGDARVTLNTLASLVESLSGVAGRKVVLYVSDGIPLRPGEDAFKVWAELCGGGAVFKAEDLTAALRKLTALANANGVTFHTLQAASLRSFSGASAEDNPQPLPAATLANLEFDKAADAQQVFFNLATETGGRAVLNGNDFKADLARVVSDLRSYYSLGYTPTRSGDGKVRAIEVKVKREGVRVRNRTTYTDRPRGERMAAQVQTALLHGIVDNPLQAGLELVSSEPAERGQHQVKLRLRLPLKQIVLVSQGAAWTGQLTLWVGARDAAGRMAPVQSVRVPVSILAAGGKEQLDRLFAYDIRMRMAERGEQTVALGIQDDLGHTTSFITAVFRVDKKGVTAASSSPR